MTRLRYAIRTRSPAGPGPARIRGGNFNTGLRLKTISRRGSGYTLFVRVRCPTPTKEGKAFSCGIYGRPPLPSIQKTVSTQTLTPNKYQVIEVGTIMPESGHGFWMALSGSKGEYAVSEVRLDCLWLRETP